MNNKFLHLLSIITKNDDTTTFMNTYKSLFAEKIFYVLEYDSEMIDNKHFEEIKNYTFYDLLDPNKKNLFIEFVYDIRNSSIDYDEYFYSPVVEYVDRVKWRKYEKILAAIENRQENSPPKEYWENVNE